MAVSLCEQGLYQWDEFRDHLIAEIAAGEQEPARIPILRNCRRTTRVGLRRSKSCW